MIQKIKNLCNVPSTGLLGTQNETYINDELNNFINAYENNILEEKHYEVFKYTPELDKKYVNIVFNTIELSGKYKNNIIKKCFNHFIFSYEYFLSYDLDTRDYIIYLTEPSELKLLIDKYIYDFTNDEIIEILIKNVNYKLDELTNRLSTLDSYYEYNVCDIINDIIVLKILCDKKILLKKHILKLNHFQLDWLLQLNYEIPTLDEFVKSNCDETIISWLYGKNNLFINTYNIITYSNILNAIIYQNYLNDLQISENLFGSHNNEYEGFDDEDCNNKILNYLKNPPLSPIIEYEIMIREYETIYNIYNIKIKNFINENIVNNVEIGKRFSLKYDV
jgi:hypothetical protein